MINKTQTQLARIASSAALGAMSTMGAVFAQSGAYLPSDDLVVVEMEDLAEGRWVDLVQRPRRLRR